ncbi:hypothetical protein CSC67_07035 [Pusillimonas caeni]|uniref:hypothetical protein n=1 Tax=Pusillimonas caeni TaxID=1348472 RepID=UPI000E5993E6|nr:hypothetical protein [Pusillimonas caeni]TFL15074.1 hypothetical protein CSC67_07035 [Pusillimonas caeni]
MAGVILQADTPTDLIVKLVQLDISVPARAEGRTNHHTERYCLAHLMATLPEARLAFPLTLTHSDKPDFLLNMPTGMVGIEHTEAVSENVARAEFFREKGLGPDVYFPLRARPGEPRKTAVQLRSEIKTDAPGPGWVGDAPQREWAAAMAHSIKGKMSKVMAGGFRRYPANWLLVYDNWRVPPFDYADAVPYLVSCLKELDVSRVFDAIFIHDDSQMCEFSETPIVHTLVKPARGS